MWRTQGTTGEGARLLPGLQVPGDSPYCGGKGAHFGDDRSLALPQIIFLHLQTT